ncbi:ICMT-domain-containing protein [Aspergillus campestris IBT 28561]|uniref:Protein-S-isoprenylcysteine O-methyltransferase n=1 Tax=Aspergillus campestris (strain IBT 28561) TaxID=1392248 RepID=A0A2I1CYR4_ASPC2|nr:ICMT-domain-containing protein [Aspergillus campestris IBT 28561]PKY02772.1 ICMT-domain-containing protein [Aspergillus campestris IBT 28561]
MTSSASDYRGQSPGNPNISWPISRPTDSSSSPEPTSSPNNNNADTNNTWHPRRIRLQEPSPPTPPPSLDRSNYPNGPKSLSGISLRAFLLGTTLGLTLSLTAVILTTTTTTTTAHPLWRAPFFLAALSAFHFLEYWVTAEYNTHYASISAFLLSSNGWAYNLAHSSAILECLLSHTLWPTLFPWSLNPTATKIQVALGLVLMAIGQITRTLAMAQAGSNFNHTVQVERKDGHTLVQHGIYAVLRHPSYFGFFWWGLGTQLVLGNVVCFVGYAFVLWNFFHNRIYREEKFLIAFFGDEYLEYRKRSWVGIPGLR